MNAPPLLSICIPTLNRLELLRDNLKHLLPQASALGVEVCVSDNGSTDGTQSFLEDLSSKTSILRVQYQEKNVGIDRNMISVISMGVGNYIYPLGDDDVIPAGKLAALLGELEAPLDLLILNGWHTDSELAPIAQHLAENLRESVFTQTSSAFGALWDKMPFGSFLASRECFRLASATKYIGSSHAYTGVIWDGLAHLEANARAIRVRCTRTPMVLIRGAAKTWGGQADLIMLQGIPRWLSIVAENKVCESTAARIRMHYLSSHTQVRYLLRLRATGQLRRQDLPQLTSECTAGQARKVIAASMIPATLLRYAVGVARSIGRRMGTVEATAG